ncbi:MAG: hypothetical protein IE878_05650 [Epsilonproteobacteria bacterium]|nr:hypothetical protein [Campylobacterota bacterium]MBD3839852.1 hypothetical protein [Campylobacterota bacterium]
MKKEHKKIYNKLTMKQAVGIDEVSKTNFGKNIDGELDIIEIKILNESY